MPHDPHTTRTYDEVVGSLQTGDVFLAHGDSLISRAVERLSWSEWSHSAMVVLAKDVGLGGQVPPVLLWESTRSTNLPDVVTGNTKKDAKCPGGTLLVDLEKRIESDIQIGETPVCFRHLTVERTPAMLAALVKVLDGKVRQAYFPDDVDFVADVLEGRLLNRGVHDHDAHFFCSQLLSYTLQHMGVLSKENVPNSYEPRSYSEEVPGLPLVGGATLGPEIWVEQIS